MPADLQKARALFLHAVGKLPPEEWDGYVGQACGGDAELEKQVGQLLQVHREAGSFLDRPAAAVGATGAYPIVSGEGAAAVPLRERPGTVIGPYKLLQQIGEGGMGTVFMAEQTRPVQRKVALKVIKAGMDSAQVIARFEAERQALAVMDHVNIARVFDGGTTENGRPYFVMELVHGVSITKYCDDNHLTPRERLELFVPVCQAIQHAHQKGIIHRDVKPSNVMITLYDGKPVPKVIDFGVAKATEQRLTERTLFTQYGTMVGTLEYMSPEQAEMSALGVDTRSDIFSLGVLLYELLTGGTPLSHKRVREAAYGEVLRMIREEEPPRPSTRLSDSGEALASISAQRHMEPAKLAKLMRGELDWIVMRCLEKDRNRRYETANAFATDIQRYLADETVLACPPSSWYRLRKFVRRNKGPVLAVCLVLLALVGGVAGTTRGLVMARQQRDVAEEARNNEAAQRQEAVEQKNRAEAAEALAKNHLADVTREKQRTDEEAAIARAVNEFLQNNLLGQADIRNQPGGAYGFASQDPDIKVRTLLDRAAREIEGKFVGQPLTEAAIRQTLGDTYRALGRYTEAQLHLERAVRLRVAKLGTNAPETLGSKNNLGNVYSAQGEYDRAEAIYKEVIDARTAKPGADDPDTLTTKNNLGNVYFAQGKYDRAEAIHKEVIAGYTPKLGAEQIDTLCSKASLGNVYFAQEKYDRAEAIYKEVIDALTAKLGADYPDTLTGKNSLAIVYKVQGKFDRAETLTKEVLDVRTAKLGADHPETLASKRNLADVYSAQGEYDRAEVIYKEVIDAHTAKPGADHPEALATKNNLGIVYLAQGKYDQAEPLYREAVAGARQKLGVAHPQTQLYVRNLVDCYKKMGQPGKADAELSKAIELKPDDAFWWRQRAGTRARGGRLDEALLDYSKALELNPADWGIWGNRGKVYLEVSQPEKALADFTRSIAIDPKVWWIWQQRSEAYHALDRWQEAIADLSKAVELAPSNDVPANELAWLLVTCPDAKLRDPSRALKTAKQAVELAPKEGSHWRTLGVAHYRSGDWQAALAALEKSMELRKGDDRLDWFFLAMVQWQLGNKDQARKRFDQAVEWMDKNQPTNVELRRFRAEAAERLDVKK